MSKFTLVGELPRHLDCFVDTRFTHNMVDLQRTEAASLFMPAIWFGLVSYPSRAWGCTVLLDSGAVYRNLPPHALVFNSTEPGPAENPWAIERAQLWDCYGTDFTTIEYDFLREHRCVVRVLDADYSGVYLFTAAPVGDAWSARPEQAKEFSFIRLDNGRLTIQPTNRVLFEDRAFTTNEAMEFPKGLRRQTEVWSCE